MSSALQELLKNRKKSSEWHGLYSVCSAHPWVIRAAIQSARISGGPLLMEATCNQVNQFGGYTGMKPADFRRFVLDLAREAAFPPNRLIFGGDHLGPNPWQHLPAAKAMQFAEEMVMDYAKAGFTKLHLDASMSCADDPPVLPDTEIAKRAARLCLAAELTTPDNGLVYIVGTEVPIPGGARESLSHLQVTTREAAQNTVCIHKEIFAVSGLERVWTRVVGLVVQPGVEFNHDSVVCYRPEKAAPLTTLLEDEAKLVFEAHSTDYQPPMVYKDLVRDGFAILKVGPALTFAMREAVFALAEIESELFPESERSKLPEVIDQAMLRNPGNWNKHYHGSDEKQRLLRKYSYSDRVRYYWADSSVQNAVEKLIGNLSTVSVPETLISAYLPDQYSRLRLQLSSSLPEALILDRIVQVLEPYIEACSPNKPRDPGHAKRIETSH